MVLLMLWRCLIWLSSVHSTLAHVHPFWMDDSRGFLKPRKVAKFVHVYGCQFRSFDSILVFIEALVVFHIAKIDSIEEISEKFHFSSYL